MWCIRVILVINLAIPTPIPVLIAFARVSGDLRHPRHVPQIPSEHDAHLHAHTGSLSIHAPAVQGDPAARHVRQC